MQTTSVFCFYIICWTVFEFVYLLSLAVLLISFLFFFLLMSRRGSIESQGMKNGLLYCSSRCFLSISSSAFSTSTVQVSSYYETLVALPPEPCPVRRSTVLPYYGKTSGSFFPNAGVRLENSLAVCQFGFGFFWVLVFCEFFGLVWFQGFFPSPFLKSEYCYQLSPCSCSNTEFVLPYL